MNTLPSELINIIITHILKITDKRQFTQTCITYNNITKSLIQNQETTFKVNLSKIRRQDVILKINHLEYSQNYCMEKFTIELCNDSYFNKIPNCYLTPKNNIIVKALTIYGQIELLTCAMKNGCNLLKNLRDEYDYFNFDDNSCAHAVLSGEIDVLKFVRSHGGLWNCETADFAAECGHLHILKFLVTNGCNPRMSASLNAAEVGHIDILHWLIENTYTMHFDARQMAARHGNLDILKILGQSKYVWNDDVCRYAAIGGSLSCLQWGIENGCKLNVSEIYGIAARWNYIHIINWLRNNGYMWDSKACEGAVRGNQLELLKWLVKEGCELDKNVYNVALYNVIENNNPEVLQWLIDNNCPRH